MGVPKFKISDESALNRLIIRLFKLWVITILLSPFIAALIFGGIFIKRKIDKNQRIERGDMTPSERLEYNRRNKDLIEKESIERAKKFHESCKRNDYFLNTESCPPPIKAHEILNKDNSCKEFLSLVKKCQDIYFSSAEGVERVTKCLSSKEKVAKAKRGSQKERHEAYLEEKETCPNIPWRFLH